MMMRRRMMIMDEEQMMTKNKRKEKEEENISHSKAACNNHTLSSLSLYVPLGLGQKPIKHNPWPWRLQSLLRKIHSGKLCHIIIQIKIRVGRAPRKGNWPVQPNNQYISKYYNKPQEPWASTPKIEFVF